MTNYNANELNRAVSLLNFELENKGRAKKLLKKRYHVPAYNISLLLHKIFIKLSTYDLGIKNINSNLIWDQFHQVASEEVKSLGYQ